MNKICLTMIVKNESKIITRCLDSAKPIIDCFSICDTGSSDNTIELIKKWGEENKISGIVHNHTWKNFGHNRTLSITSAKESYPGVDYLLFLDADMILKIGTFKKEMLQEGGYMLIQDSGSLKYYNIRLVKASLDWVCLGATHEYYECKVPCNKCKIDEKIMYIDDRNDGGSKSDKFSRDIKLLTQEINEINPRPFFYLANSLKDSGKFNEAIHFYYVRIQMGGFQEEVWNSMFQIGNCYRHLTNIEAAAGAYLKAYEMRPTRAEPLYEMAKMYRELGNNIVAYTIAKLGKDIAYPKDDLLFVHNQVYEYLLDYEISIVAYYVPGKREDGKWACRRLLKMDIPEDLKKEIEKNYKFYTEK